MELGKIAFANGQWAVALKQFEEAWKHIDRKNRPYRQIASRKLRKTIAQVLVEWATLTGPLELSIESSKVRPAGLGTQTVWRDG